MANKLNLSLSILGLVLLFFVYLTLISNLHYTSHMQKAPEFFSTVFHDFNSNKSIVHDRTKRFKTILLFNDPHPLITMYFGSNGHDPFLHHGCPVSDCELFIKPSNGVALNQFDAILVRADSLHKLPLNTRKELSSFDPKQRSVHQRYIFFTQEAPYSLPPETLTNFNGIFNWTMTYKQDSDIFLAYGNIEARNPDKGLQKRNFVPGETKDFTSKLFENKTKLVAWFVTHCKTYSGREKYVQKLQNYVSVDIYGECGNITCAKIAEIDVSDSRCYDMVENTYKFYLSFENSLCKDYVTEKLFLILQRRIVPIVYGKADYRSFLPEHSYIDAFEYTPEGLATYLKYLDKNDTAYQEYFWWKPFFQVHAGWSKMSPRAMCALCAKLHEPLTHKVYPCLPDFHGINQSCFK